MDVYIKNIELPKHDDEYVIFTVYGDGGVVYGPLNRPHVRYKNRAVPVPAHGRLIDADALIEKVIAKYLEHERKGELVFAAVEIKQDIVDLISDAPTIIPASEEAE